ncbi:MAG: hypothetical protein WA191_07040 [Telluria sp.]|jgi:hypothetical protein
MDSGPKATALDKVVAKACKWLDSRQAKAAAPDEQRRRAQFKHLRDGNELAEAVEKFRKAER